MYLVVGLAVLAILFNLIVALGVLAVTVQALAILNLAVWAIAGIIALVSSPGWPWHHA